jgi:hypothetical protein
MFSFSDKTWIHTIRARASMPSTSCELQRVLNETMANVALELVTSYSHFSFQFFILCLCTPCIDANILKFFRRQDYKENFRNGCRWQIWTIVRNVCRGVSVNLLKPAGHVMHQQFNIQQLYALPTLYLCVLYLSENKQRHLPLTA